jgi:hypothetical protein
MIVVVAAQWDQSARAFASRWAAHNVHVLTPPDLSVAGWCQVVGVPGRWMAVVEGVVLPQEEITGVLVRLPAVVEEALPAITAEDRSYVAAEMTAFMLFWLSSLRCPVLNRPTPAYLPGPHWRRESWVRAAAVAGIPVQPVHRRAPLPPAAGGATFPFAATVTVVGERSFGEADPILHSHGRCLAALTQVELLAVQFTGRDRHAHLINADLFPDLSDDSIAEAVLDHFERASERRARA